MLMRKGQSWSMDIVIAVIVFGFVTLTIGSFVLLNQPDAERLQTNSQVVFTHLASDFNGCGPVLRGNQLNITNLECLYEQEYDIFRQQQGIRHDFCLFLEDEDGNLWTFQNGALHAWGSDRVIVGDNPCVTGP